MRSPRSSATRSSRADYIVPSVFNRDVVTSVAAAVAAAADEDGVSRRAREPLEEGAAGR